MRLTSTSIGLAVRAGRSTKKMTLGDLSACTGIGVSALSRVENGLRSLEFTEAVAVAAAFKIDLEHLRTLAETFEAEGAPAKQKKQQKLKADLVRLQRLAIESAIDSLS